MAEPTFILLAGEQSWRIGRLEGAAAAIHDVPAPVASQRPAETREESATSPAEPSPASTAGVEDWADAIVRTLRSLGHRHQPLALALPSDWCMGATISTDGLPRQGRRAAMVYRLEERLPLAAEDVAADFITQGDSAFGICVAVERAADWIRALEERGLSIALIAPSSLLALQAWMPGLEPLLHSGSDEDGPAFALIGDDARVELVGLSPGPSPRPRAWHLLEADADEIAMYVASHGGNGNARVVTHGICDALVAALGGRPELRVINGSSSGDESTAPGDAIQHAALAAASAGLRGQTPWINLRRDALAPSDRYAPIRTSLSAAVLAAAFCTAAVCAALLWQSYQLGRQARALRDREGVVFAQAMPGKSVPSDVRLYLRSEGRKIDEIASANQLPQRATSMLQLALVLDRLRTLPPSLRFQVDHISLDHGKLVLDGKTTAMNLADQIAAALRSDGAFDVDEPTSKQMDGPIRGVTFTLMGQKHVAPAASPRGPAPGAPGQPPPGVAADRNR